MSEALDRLRTWLDDNEDERCEFKEAKQHFDFDRLVKYCAGLANGGGGKILLGVTDERPRRIVGTRAFEQPERTRVGLCDRLRLNIDFETISHPDGRVLVFYVPSRPVGMPIQDKGIYWSREGDQLVHMDQRQLRAIFGESGRDFSAEICKAANISDLAPPYIEEFRRRWIVKSGNAALAQLSVEQLLTDAELLVEGRVTHAALVLLGTRESLGRHLAQAEVTYEYRTSDASGPAQARKEYRLGFFGYYDQLWNDVELRNEVQHYQDGFFLYDIPTFSERPIRELILNAVSHRDYQLGSNVFVRQYHRRIEVVSPGGLPHQITLENILDRQSPRNRRIADVFLKCGLVERSGQGMNLIYEDAIRQSKELPDFSQTDQFQVGVTLHGTVTEPNFVRFLEAIGRERATGFSTADWLILSRLSRGEQPSQGQKAVVERLVNLGVLERAGRGKFMLSRTYYSFVGQKGAYTRMRGLDRETNKKLLLKHIRDNRAEGGTMREFLQILPSHTRKQVRSLLEELRDEGLVRQSGTKRGSRWYPSPSKNSEGWL